MGLVANVIEDAGIPTACLSMIPSLTRATGAPRVIGVAHCDDRAAQLRGAARVWPEPRSQAIRHPDPPPPIAQLLARKPWLLPKLASGDIPDR